MDQANESQKSEMKYLEALKDQGNQYFASKDFKGALESYTAIIDSCSQEIMHNIDIMRTALANRAACYLGLQKYNQALADCHFILDRMAPPPQKSSPLNPLLQKVHYRIAQAYYHLQQYSSALEHLDQFIWLGGLREKGSELRMRVLNDQVHQDWAPPPVIPSEVLPGGSKLRITLKPMNYIQRAVMVRGETVTSIEYEEAVPIEFCELPPPKGGKKFLEELIMAHHEDFMALRAWKCFNCAKPAASSLHSALSYLHLEPAQVVDYMLPICKDCDKVGKEFLLVEMAAVQGYRKGLTH